MARKAKATKADMESLLNRVIGLVDDNQLEIGCSDAQETIDEIKEALGIGRSFDTIFLPIEIYDIYFPAGVDPWDESTYEITVRIAGTDYPFSIGDIEGEEAE